MSKNEELIIEFEEVAEEDGADAQAASAQSETSEKIEDNTEIEEDIKKEDIKKEANIKSEEELLLAFEKEYNEGRDERAEAAVVENSVSPIREDEPEDEPQDDDKPEDAEEFFDEEDESEDDEENFDKVDDTEEFETIELDDEETSEIKSEGLTDAARALEEYEKRMEAEEAAKKKEEAEIYRQLMHEEESPKEISENAPEENALSGETFIAAAVSKKTIAENERAVKEEQGSPEEAWKVEVSERVAAEEKKPVYITEAGRLPLSVSIETYGKIVSRIAQIGDVLPVRCTREFFVETTGVTSAALNLYAGERPFTSQNRLIKKLKFKGAHVMTPGKAVITVEFEIDKDCNIKVSVIDEGSLKKSTAVIDGSWVPSKDEIYGIVTEAQENLTRDNKQRERVRMLRQARESLSGAKEALHSRKKKLSKEQKNVIKKKCRRLTQRLKRAKLNEMSALTEKGIIDAITSLNNELR